MESQEVTKVIFRMFNSEVIALFPEDPGTNNPLTCSSYGTGGHCSADYDRVILASRPATEEEFSSLKIELERMDYNLKVMRRTTSWAYQKRLQIIKGVG